MCIISFFFSFSKERKKEKKKKKKKKKKRRHSRIKQTGVFAGWRKSITDNLIIHVYNLLVTSGAAFCLLTFTGYSHSFPVWPRLVWLGSICRYRVGMFFGWSNATHKMLHRTKGLRKAHAADLLTNKWPLKISNNYICYTHSHHGLKIVTVFTQTESYHDHSIPHLLQDANFWFKIKLAENN